MKALQIAVMLAGATAAALSPVLLMLAIAAATTAAMIALEAVQTRRATA